MNTPTTSCELLSGGSLTESGSRILRLERAGGDRPFEWRGVPLQAYKEAAEHWRGVTRMSLVGGSGESTAFHVRYFELAPAGFTSLEQHIHEHVVFVLRGQGQVQLGDKIHDLRFGDTVYVAPSDPHQFRNPSASEPFGFLCIVDAKRDRPTVFP